ncbi:MAG: insulinase family protein [Nitrospirae bacterium]|nr:insulinase family protein [Nitrospirota bacterium]
MDNHLLKKYRSAKYALSQAALRCSKEYSLASAIKYAESAVSSALGAAIRTVNSVNYAFIGSIVCLIAAVLITSCATEETKTREEPKAAQTQTAKASPPKPQSVPQVKLDVKEYKLENGLKVLIVEDHKAPIATFQVWYRVGSIYEHAGKTGISHLLEHMMFKGTPRFGSKVFSNIIQKHGGTDNAFTTKNYTMYYQTLISSRLDLSIDMESDRMVNLMLRPEDFKSERQVVMEERRLRTDDNPQDYLLEEVTSKAFAVHPYGNPVIGWMKDIESITVGDLRKYYENYYNPSNAVIVISGDVNPESAMKMIKEKFGPIPGRIVERPAVPAEPQQTEEKRITVKKQAQMPALLMVYHVPSIPQKDSYALDVLATIFSGKSGRLYQNLVRNQRIALNAMAFYSGLSLDPDLFYFSGTPAQGKDTSELENSLLKEIDMVKTNPPSEQDVQKAKNQIEASFIMGQDSIYFQGEILGMYEMLGDWHLKDKYLDEINIVRPEDVQRVAQKYFTKENRTAGVLLPAGK